MAIITRAGALMAAAALLAGPAAAQDDACKNPQSACGELISRDCLTSLGAGAIAAAPEASCAAQMTSYRECLAAIVERCPTGPQQDVNVEADKLEELGALGGLVAEPKTVVEFYNNALVYSRRGDLLNGRRMLEKAIAAGADSVDIHQRYAQLLKAQEGLVGAREIYADLARRAPDNKGAALASALLAPANRREAALRALVDGDEPFAPAYYEIANLFSADRLGDQSIDDLRAEKAALEAFAAADEAGRVYRWFLQKDLVEVWRESVRRRLAALRNRNFDAPQVTLTAQASNDSWMLVLNIAEPARAVRYRVNGGAITDTGHLSFINQATGAPQPRTFFNLPLGTESAEIEVWYNDVRDVERGPFALRFNATDAFVASTKSVLETVTTKWISGRDYDGRQLIYFTHLISYRCGLSDILYGVERDTPDRSWPITACDPKNPGAIGDADKIYEEFDPKVSKISIQLIYKDGSKSPIRIFEF